MSKRLGDKLEESIVDGEKGLNRGYKVGIDRMPDLIQRALTTILGGTGSGKSMLATLPFSIDPLLDWYTNTRLKEPHKIFHLTFFSFEMPEDEVILRIASYLLAKSESRMLIPAYVIGGYEGELSTEAKVWLLQNGKDILNKLSPYITIKSKASVEEIAAYNKKFYEQYGTIERDEDGELTYVTDKQILHQIIIDHVALLKGDHKKSKIDHLAEMEVEHTNFYRTSFLNVQQLNRSEGSIEKLKSQETPQPTLAEAKDSGDLIDASRLVIALFNPHRFNIAEYLGYQIASDYSYDGLEDSARFLFILKRRHGKLGFVPTAFYGESGVFQMMPEPKPTNPIRGIIYYTKEFAKSIINRTYWLGSKR